MLAHADGILNLKRLAPSGFIPCWCLSQKGMVFFMIPIIEIVEKILNKFINFEGYQTAWLSKHWENIVGPVMKGHSEPYKLSKKQLYIRVDSSVWNQAIFIEKKRIIKKINQTYLKQIVDDINIQIGYKKALNEKKESGIEKIDFSNSAIRINRHEKIVLRALNFNRRKK
jgi:hypothetical protein